MQSKLLILFAFLHLFLYQIANGANVIISSTPSSFDSYPEMSDAEEYPDVCSDYSNENCAREWIIQTNEVSKRNSNRISNLGFKYSTDINKVNLKLKTQMQKQISQLDRKFERKARKFLWILFQNSDVSRILKKLGRSIKSNNESIDEELINKRNEIKTIYNKAKPCLDICLAEGESGITNLFQNERNYDRLAEFWVAWRNVTGAKIRNLFVERMNLENQGAIENNYTDSSTFKLMDDFETENFNETVLHLYSEILPLYKELHAYVRYCLERYYPGRFDKNGPIPAHIVGNVWAQSWQDIFPIIKQCREKNQTNSFQNEVNENLKKYSVKDMFRKSEEFYQSIGMPKMTDQFWDRSMFSEPSNKLVDCHGSAYNFFNGKDYRITMCTNKNIGDFKTIHHEMGHIQYFMAYRHQLMVNGGSANAGFHESIGDTIALSVKTPEHFHKIGLISEIPNSDEFDIDYLMVTALEKIAFLPFALTIDSFIWSVYNGSVPSSKLNEHWWNLRHRFQGIKPPVERSENDFDPGSKYHIAFGVSYIRYFVSYIIQFQFYESMCRLSGHHGPLHRCDFYQSKEAGEKLLQMLRKGSSQKWEKTIEILTGSSDIQSNSLLKFFEPLFKWLKKTNKDLNIPVGW